ncbi:MAG: glycosyltransferase family 2 protein [Bryobacteraceae bacterium]|jgi:glycosyltransferase involved in cell wall biosynthesis
MEPSEVFVIIPAFNENAVLRSTVSGVVSFGYTVVVIDDGSDIPAKSHLEGLDVYCLRHAVNLGQGAALQTGGEFALIHGARVIVHFDADGQHRPELIERLVNPIVHGKVEVVLGSRFLDANDRRMVPRRKRILLKTAAFVSWAFTGVWLSDAHNGFRALSRTAAAKIQLKENGFAHATEILDLLRRAKLSWQEVPVTIRYTSYSQAKGQSMFNSFNIVIDLMLRKLFK